MNLQDQITNKNVNQVVSYIAGARLEPNEYIKFQEILKKFAGNIKLKSLTWKALIIYDICKQGGARTQGASQVITNSMQNDSFSLGSEIRKIILRYSIKIL